MPRHTDRSRPLAIAGFLFCLIGIALHLQTLAIAMLPGGSGLTLATAVSMIGFELAAIAGLSALKPDLRGVAAGMVFLGAICALPVGQPDIAVGTTDMSWQIRVHVVTSMLAYGLLTVGAIVAVFALIQDKRLRSGQLSASNALFAPLDTTEKLLFSLTAAGFTVLALSIVTGFTFVENLFAQHLVHKTALSLIAIVLFGILLAGRWLAGWRGRRAIYLYLAAFVVLGLGYFGSRLILEVLLGRTWG